MLTARDGGGRPHPGLDVGADDYLVKPFDFGELVARLRALLRRGAPERPAVLASATSRSTPPLASSGARAASSADRARVRRTRVPRAPRGQVVTRTELLDHVWDEHYEGSANIVDVYVGYLRRKLEIPSVARSSARCAAPGYVVDPP